MIRSLPTTVAVVVLASVAGCGPSRPGRIVPPALDPEGVTAAVMARADADGDGIIEKPELAGCHALVAAMEVIDRDRDGGIATAELRQWLDDVKASRVAIMALAGEIRHLRRPLADVTIRLVPEPFMGTEVLPAEGQTDSEGRFSASIPNAVYPGVNCGLYRVEITGRGNDGKPLPASYNTQSKLGLAVGGPLPLNGLALFMLD